MHSRELQNCSFSFSSAERERERKEKRRVETVVLTFHGTDTIFLDMTWILVDGRYYLLFVP